MAYTTGVSNARSNPACVVSLQHHTPVCFIRIIRVVPSASPPRGRCLHHHLRPDRTGPIPHYFLYEREKVANARTWHNHRPRPNISDHPNGSCQPKSPVLAQAATGYPTPRVFRPRTRAWRGAVAPSPPQQFSGTPPVQHRLGTYVDQTAVLARLVVGCLVTYVRQPQGPMEPWSCYSTYSSTTSCPRTAAGAPGTSLQPRQSPTANHQPPASSQPDHPSPAPLPYLAGRPSCCVLLLHLGLIDQPVVASISSAWRF